MKIVCLFITGFFLFSGFVKTDLNKVRENYSQFKSNKELCLNTMIELSKMKDKSPIHLAYLGALQTIWANHNVSPISKLNTFKKGKDNIELAIVAAPENVEIRFIRLSVQKNAPSFLFYNSNIMGDKDFIKKHLHQIESNVLLENISELLKD